MPKCRQCNAFDVIGRHEIATVDQRDDTCRTHQRDRAARARADRKAWPFARRAHDAHRVVDDAFIDALSCCDLLQA